MCCKYFTLENSDKKTLSFLYQHTGKIDIPQPFPKTCRNFYCCKEHLSWQWPWKHNIAYTALIDLTYGKYSSKGDKGLDCTDAFERDLQKKVQNRRHMLQKFPHFTLCPKYHYILSLSSTYRQWDSRVNNDINDIHNKRDAPIFFK